MCHKSHGFMTFEACTFFNVTNSNLLPTTYAFNILFVNIIDPAAGETVKVCLLLDELSDSVNGT